MYTSFIKQHYSHKPRLPIPNPVKIIPLFLAYLDLKQYAPATISTYLSLVNHIHKSSGGTCFIQHQLIKKVLSGIYKSSKPNPKREPITLSLLHRLHKVLARATDSHFDLILYRAIFTFMYHSCARVGELSVSGGQKKIILHLSHLQLTEPRKVLVNFGRFKHNASSLVHTIPLIKDGSPVCPVANISAFLELRHSKPGYLFAYPDGNPVSAKSIWTTLEKALVLLRLDPKRYGTHSFRIGRCTDLAKQGASEPKIMSLGRFHSGAFMKYIRSQAML